MPSLPPVFLDRLSEILPKEHLSSVLKSFETPGALSVRINTLKADKKEVCNILKQSKIGYEDVSWPADAFVLSDMTSKELSGHDLLKGGCLYIQGLSSMLPAMVLDPRPGERVLDFCAAPGSKTTQMAALMGNRGDIVAVESVRNRFYRLKSVVSLLGAGIVSLKMTDARKLKSFQLFDKILVDVPCSSEGRFKTFDPKTYAYWSLRKIKEMVKKQRGLLLSASRLLKPNGILVYSTCTFAPEENEGVVDWLLQRKDNPLDVAAIECEGVKKYPALSRWGKKEYHPQVSHCLRVLPSIDGHMEGFFIAKLVKTR